MEGQRYDNKKESGEKTGNKIYYRRQANVDEEGKSTGYGQSYGKDHRRIWPLASIWCRYSESGFGFETRFCTRCLCPCREQLTQPL